MAPKLKQTRIEFIDITTWKFTAFILSQTSVIATFL